MQKYCGLFPQGEKKGRDCAMKTCVFAILVVAALVTSASAQSSLFDKYDVNMTKWAQLPAGTAWGGVTTWVAADGKGTDNVRCVHFVVGRASAERDKELEEEGRFKLSQLWN